MRFYVVSGAFTSVALACFIVDPGVITGVSTLLCLGMSGLGWVEGWE